MAIEKIESHPIIDSLKELYESDWKKDHPHDKKPRLYFYVSDAGKCKRQLFYQFINPEQKKPMSSRTIMIFKLGDLFHDEVEQNLKRLKYTTSKDIEFGTFGNAPFDPRGRLDLFLVEQNQLVITDIKSKNPYAFQDEPGEDEVGQLLFYIYQCKRDKSLQAKKMSVADYGYLLYVDRGGLSDSPFCMWKVEYSEEKVEAMREEFSKLWSEIQERRLPMRAHDRDSVQCQYCRFREFCWEGIPKPEKPILVIDETIEPPEQELVESMARQYVKTKGEEAKAKEEAQKAKDILLKYFKATGAERIFADGNEICREVATITIFDREKLLSECAEKWTLIAEPKMELLKEAIKKGELDPEIFEVSKRYEYQERLRIKKSKEVKHAD